MASPSSGAHLLSTVSSTMTARTTHVEGNTLPEITEIMQSLESFALENKNSDLDVDDFLLEIEGDAVKSGAKSFMSDIGVVTKLTDKRNRKPLGATTLENVGIVTKPANEKRRKKIAPSSLDRDESDALKSNSSDLWDDLSQPDDIQKSFSTNGSSYDETIAETIDSYTFKDEAKQVLELWGYALGKLGKLTKGKGVASDSIADDESQKVSPETQAVWNDTVKEVEDQWQQIATKLKVVEEKAEKRTRVITDKWKEVAEEKRKVIAENWKVVEDKAEEKRQLAEQHWKVLDDEHHISSKTSKTIATAAEFVHSNIGGINIDLVGPRKSKGSYTPNGGAAVERGGWVPFIEPRERILSDEMDDYIHDATELRHWEEPAMLKKMQTTTKNKRFSHM
mmetsp:Transcript_2512/g.4569  ORF Transcript_2512/g.4569 Transcript_2512/m.4569 type:complete len:394 (-) Transcript_2512:785-1966(-)